ncbi:nephrin-like [Penaeus monodon]|uniref:nephrin-like n=1 Tax=Penaeus monodon TaxID=6687 RepID=UPI0018A7A90C|nr:nephrin-like [Penaeus monodon]
MGFVRDVPGYPRYRYAGDGAKGEHHLVIKGVTLQDDGEYQCQVGPTSNASAIWVAANLTVLVSPGSISIGGLGDGEKLEVKAGQRLTLDCVVRDARPAPSVTWYRSGLRLDSALHEEKVFRSSQGRRWSVRSSLRLMPSSEDDERQYSCRALHPALEGSPTSLVASVVLSVLPLHEEKVFRSSQGRRWSVRSSLRLMPSSEDDERQYSCRALHPALEGSPTSLVASVVLSVLHPPRLPEILGYKTGEVLLEGERRLLTCMVDSGNPRPVVEWQRHGRPTGMVHDDPGWKATLTPSGGYFYNHQEGSHILNVTQEVTATQQEDSAVYECRVYNKLLTQPLSANVTLTVHYPPEDVTLYGPLTVAPGQVFSVICITSPANPPAEINWMIQGIQTNSVPIKVTEDMEGGWVTSSELTSDYMSLVNMSEVALACRSHNPASDWVVSESRVITLTKPPGRPLLTLEETDGFDNPGLAFEEASRDEGMGKEEDEKEEEQDAVKEGPESMLVMRAVAGRALRVECSSEGGNPAPDITLYMNREKIFANLTQTGKITKAQSQIEVKSTDKDSEVVCEVANPATTTPLRARITLVVLFPPLEAHGWVTPDTVEEGSKVILVCQTSLSFPASNITWHSKGDEIGSGLVVRSQAANGGTVTRYDSHMV